MDACLAKKEVSLASIYDNALMTEDTVRSMLGHLRSMNQILVTEPSDPEGKPTSEQIKPEGILLRIDETQYTTSRLLSALRIELERLDNLINIKK